MNMENPNLVLAWLWILFGFACGMVLGLFFHRENWLGGYASFKRRMYRLAHISFFGLGAVNLLFWLTMKTLRCDDSLAGIASWAFVVGAVSMPLCCVVMAQFPKARMLFPVPVISLLLGGVLMLVTLLRQPAGPTTPTVAVVATRPVRPPNETAYFAKYAPAVATVATRPARPSDFDFRNSDSVDRTSDTTSFDSQPINSF
jgi:hypothetical protein